MGAEPVLCAHKKAYVAFLEDLEIPFHGRGAQGKAVAFAGETRLYEIE